MASKCRMQTLVAVVFCFLLYGPTTSSGASSQRDALHEDAEDAEIYAKYMAATEASAPLVRIASSGSGSHWTGVSGSSVYYHRQPASIRSSSSHVILHHQLSTSLTSAESVPVKSIVSVSEQQNLPDWSLPSYPFSRPVVYVWSAWSAWTKCSRTCGTGVMSRHRTCRREYARISTGSGIRFTYQRCIGEPTEYSLCNTQHCSVTTEDFRQFQCSLYSNRTVKGQTVRQWVPYTTGLNPCELTCAAIGNGFHYTFGKVLDGTRCTLDLENPETDFCVNGRCMSVGCDGRIGSNQKIDFCNVCGGNNSTCSRVSGMAYSSITSLGSYSSSTAYGYNSVVKIPRGANHVRVTDNSSNYLAVMDERQRYILNGNWIIDWPGRYETASGVVVHYDRSRDFESVSMKGPLLEDIIIMILVRDKNPGIFYEYWLPRITPSSSSSSTFRLSLDSSKSSSGLSLSPARAVLTTASTTLLPLTTTPTTTTTTTTTPRTTTTAANLHFKVNKFEEYEPQPTAASLIRSPSRMSLHRTAIIRAGMYQHLPTVTAMTTPTTPATPKTMSRNNGTLQVDSGGRKKKIPITRTGAKKTQKKKSKVKKGQHHCGSDPTCWKTKNGKKHFCLSEFVLRCKVLSYEVINSETRYEVQVMQSYKNTIPILNKEFIWAEATNCACPYLTTGAEYIIMGKTDRGFRRNEARLLLDQHSYVRLYNKVNLQRVMRIRRNEAKYCQKYRTQFNLTT